MSGDFHLFVDAYNMKLTRVWSLLVLVSSPLWAVQIGDTYEQVIAEKGAPTAKLEAGPTMILSYADQRIKLKAGKVVSADSKLPEAAVVPAQPEAPTHAGPTIKGGVWTTDYKAAMAQAKATDGKVFLFFTGSDWCGWCKRLDREVLSTRDFVTYAEKNLILVKLDFPRGFRLPADVAKQNEQLTQMYQVGGFPTVVVLDSKGRISGRLGYQPGGPGAFIDSLKSLKTVQ